MAPSRYRGCVLTCPTFHIRLASWWLAVPDWCGRSTERCEWSDCPLNNGDLIVAARANYAQPSPSSQKLEERERGHEKELGKKKGWACVCVSICQSVPRAVVHPPSQPIHASFVLVPADRSCCYKVPALNCTRPALFIILFRGDWKGDGRC